MPERPGSQARQSDLRGYGDDGRGSCGGARAPPLRECQHPWRGDCWASDLRVTRQTAGG